ncbi:MAG: exonuclease domain-containing protein [Sphaerochaeta sp.]
MLFSELKDFTIIDTETTSKVAKYTKLIEFGAVKFRNGKMVDKYQTLVNPHCSIPEDATIVNGINDGMVKSAKDVRNASKDIYSFIGDDILVAHNAFFDMTVLNSRLESGLINEYIDTHSIFKQVLKLEKYNLNLIREYYQIPTSQRHRALDDVYLLYKCLMKINEPYKINVSKPLKQKGNYCITSIHKTENISDILDGLTCVVTGDIPGVSRKEMYQLIVNHGGNLSRSVLKRTRFLIVGESKIGNKKVEEAEAKIANGDEIEIINYNDFFDILEMAKK